MHRALRLALVAAFFAGPALVHAAESADMLDRERIRSGLWVGPAVINGLLQLRTDSVNSDTTLDYLPAVAVGAEVWPDPNAGGYVAAEIGTGAGIVLPEDLGGATASFNLYRLEAGGRYRWYFGPRSSAPSIALVGGVRVRIQTAQAQQPSILLDRVVGGPEGGLAFAWPIVSDRVWFRVSGRAGAPFFVRESPDDSGQADSTLAFGGRLDIAVRVVGGFYAQLVGDFQDETVDFVGDGTRAVGVSGARTHDRFITGGLYLRYAL